MNNRGGQFIGFKKLSGFQRITVPQSNAVTFTSPALKANLDWNEMVLSWNVEMPSSAWLIIEARAIYDDHATRFYNMGRWSRDLAQYPRESVLHQKDADGNVSTDTLVLSRPCRKFQVRLTVGGPARAETKIKFLGVSLTDSTAKPAPLPPEHLAWGKTLPVPERSQMAYPNGGVLCSPTTVSMLLAYWAQERSRSEWEKDVPEITSQVWDTNWKGTGNWSFNVAYAGSLPGLRAYVTRLSDVVELEMLIAKGIPVGLSVCYNRLRGKSKEPSGHLVVCVGFTEQGDPVINDPGTSRNVRKTFSRENLVSGWAYSHNTVYLVYPEGTGLPRNRFGHW